MFWPLAALHERNISSFFSACSTSGVEVSIALVPGRPPACCPSEVPKPLRKARVYR